MTYNAIRDTKSRGLQKICWNKLDTWIIAKCRMSFRKYFIHFRHYRLQNYWPYCFSFGNLKFPMAVVHSDLYIGSLSILDMGQADKSCFSLVSQTEFFLICPLRPCHAFCESFGHDKSYENVFTWGRPKYSILLKELRKSFQVFTADVQNKGKQVMIHLRFTWFSYSILIYHVCYESISR